MNKVKHCRSKLNGLLKVKYNTRSTTQFWLCIKTGIQERGTECGERNAGIAGNRGMLYSGECPQTFRRMFSNNTENTRACCKTPCGKYESVWMNVHNSN